MSLKRHTILLGIDGVSLDLFLLLFEQSIIPFTKSIWHRLWSLGLPIDPYTDSKPSIKPARKGERAYSRFAGITKTVMRTGIY